MYITKIELYKTTESLAEFTKILIKYGNPQGYKYKTRYNTDTTPLIYYNQFDIFRWLHINLMKNLNNEKLPNSLIEYSRNINYKKVSIYDIDHLFMLLFNIEFDINLMGLINKD